MKILWLYTWIYTVKKIVMRRITFGQKYIRSPEAFVDAQHKTAELAVGYSFWWCDPAYFSTCDSLHVLCLIHFWSYWSTENSKFRKEKWLSEGKETDGNDAEHSNRIFRNFYTLNLIKRSVYIYRCTKVNLIKPDEMRQQYIWIKLTFRYGGSWWWVGGRVEAPLFPWT